MFDARLTWIKYLMPLSGMTIVRSIDRKSNALKSLEQYFSEYESFIKIVKDCSHGVFRPLVSDSKYDLVLYLIDNRVSRRFIQTKLNKASQRVVAEFTIVSGWQNPRWFISKERKLRLRTGVNIFNPSRMMSRIAIKLFSSLWISKSNHFILPCRIILASKRNNFNLLKKVNHGQNFQKLCNEKCGSGKFGIIYSGTPGPLQKFTVELINKDSNPLAYAKFGHDQFTQNAITREADALNEIGSLTFNILKVPKLMGVETTEFWDDKVLFQKHLAGGTSAKKLSKPIFQALVELFFKTKTNQLIPISTFVNQFSERMDRLNNLIISNELSNSSISLLKIIKILNELFGEQKIPLSMSHGDFTRWNVREDGENVYAIDWEEAKLRAPGHDLLNYLFRESLFCNSSNPEKAGRILRQVFLRKCSDDIQQFFEDIVPNFNSNINIFVLFYLCEIITYYQRYIYLSNKKRIPITREVKKILDVASQTSILITKDIQNRNLL